LLLLLLLLTTFSSHCPARRVSPSLQLTPRVVCVFSKSPPFTVASKTNRAPPRYHRKYTLIVDCSSCINSSPSTPVPAAVSLSISLICLRSRRHASFHGFPAPASPTRQRRAAAGEPDSLGSVSSSAPVNHRGAQCVRVYFGRLGSSQSLGKASLYAYRGGEKTICVRFI